MDWRFVVPIILASLFGIATIVLTIRNTRKKKPVWALNIRQIIGLGTDAPPELKVTFNGQPVNDIYRTVFIFFNKGRETIRKNDVAETVAVHFEGANILREPTILATSREANKFSLRQPYGHRDNASELNFLYLDHDDGAVVEVLHSRSENIKCSGTIMDAKEIGYIGEFLPRRPPRWLAIIYGCFIPLSIFLIFVLSSVFTDGFVNLQNKNVLPLFVLIMLFIIVNLVRLVRSDIPIFYRYLKFPKWAGFLRLPLSDDSLRRMMR